MIVVRTRIFGGLTALAVAITAYPARAGGITLLNVVNSDGYQFTNFDGPTPNTAGTTINGISNSGTIVGFTTPDNANFNNFTANPLTSTNANLLDINNSTTAMANGINSAGVVVGTDGNNNAFSLNGNSLVTFIPNGGVSAIAFGINDKGMIAGQYTTNADTTPGFVLNGTTVTTINALQGRMSSLLRASTTRAWPSVSTSARTVRTTASSSTRAPRSTTSAPAPRLPTL